MKLRTKLTVFSILLIVVAIAVCCALILSFAQQREMRDVVAQGLADYSSLHDSFSWRAAGNRPAQPVVRRSYLIYLFRSLSDTREFTLRIGEEFLINNIGYDIENLIQEGAAPKTSDEGAIAYKIVRVKGADYFIAHATAQLGAETYDISLMRDISSVTDSLRALGVKCVLSGLAVSLAAAAIMWLIVYQAMKPIQKLKDSAAELAAGHYENRIAIAGKDELSELASDFNSMADAIETTIGELREKSERQQAFINDLSHELKTPVTSILLSAETLLGRKLPPKTVGRSLERIYDQGKWMEALSQKLMTLVMLQGEIALRPESVAAVLEAVQETTADALREKNMRLLIHCTIDALPMDFDLLRAALVNLVENARKASAKGQAIGIYAHDNEIAVIDHGQGIPPEEIARVIEPFYTVDRSRSKKHGGTGLGLALVKRIAAAHGAALVIESALGQGTTVRLRFQAPK